MEGIEPEKQKRLVQENRDAEREAEMPFWSDPGVIPSAGFACYRQASW